LYAQDAAARQVEEDNDNNEEDDDSSEWSSCSFTSFMVIGAKGGEHLSIFMFVCWTCWIWNNGL
jgi:hypothetical protein